MKKLLSIVMLICITASSLTSVYAVDYGEELQNAPIKTYEQKFSDVPESYWAFAYIAEMSDRGVLNGYPDGKFYPDSQVTRAEFAKIMTKAAGFSIAEPTMQIFSDVQITDWYAPYVHTAKEYLSAYTQNGSSYYLPNTPALREDIAVALVKLKGYSTTGADMTALPRMFSDYQSISENAKIYVAAAIENGLISGYEDGTFKGQNSITRAEAATLLWRAYQYGNANKTYGNTPNNSNQNTNNINNNTDTSNNSQTANNNIIEEVKKPYVIKKLASADLDNSSLATLDDDNNIFYIDKGDNCVYKISVSNGSKSKYFDTTKLSYKKTEEQENDIVEEVTEIVETGEYEEIEEEITETTVDEETGEEIEITKTVTKQVPITKEVKGHEIKTIAEEVTIAEYTSFVPLQVFYDNVNDKLFLNGYYENLVKAGKSPQTGEYQFIYDITSKSEKVHCIPRCDYYHDLPITVVLNSSYLIVSSGYISFKINVIDGSSERISMLLGWVSGLKYGNDLYGFSGNGHDGCICQYDFSKDNYESITDNIYYNSFGIKDDCYYFWKRDGSIFKMSVRNLMTTALDINTKSENVDFEDMGNMQNIGIKFFVIDDDTFVFYDTNMKAFRILEKQ
ncbi:MAG: S-layer homology domain-containing protein [Clostridiales bacterium]|nr:S-layer homology domain-containing protein [Clostridiales bacterium]